MLKIEKGIPLPNGWRVKQQRVERVKSHVDRAITKFEIEKVNPIPEDFVEKEPGRARSKAKGSA